MSFDFSQPDWQNHPRIVRQKMLVYGGILSEMILELVIRRAAKSMQNGEAKRVLLYQRLVDKILMSTRTLQKMKVSIGSSQPQPETNL